MSDAGLLLRATLRLYERAVRDASKAFVRNPWLALAAPVYALALQLIAPLVGGFGMAGGFLMGLAIAGLVSSFLALLEVAVEGGRLDSSELGPSFGRHLSRVISVLFVLWIVQILLGLIVSTNPAMAWLVLVVNLGLFVLCNPLPELIYLGNRDGMALLDEAVSFVRDNAVEWLLPLLVALAPLLITSPISTLFAISSFGPGNALLVVQRVVSRLLPGLGAASGLLGLLVAGALLAWLMLFRGFLFQSLRRGGRRQRVFEARARGL